MAGSGQSSGGALLDRCAALAADLITCLKFSTRLPIAPATAIDGAELARALWALPLAGAIVGMCGTAVYCLAALTNVPPVPAAALAIATTAVVTGCLHEDGLADVADGLGGATRAHRLQTMRDSQIGTYGACALIIALLLRVTSLASLGEPRLAASALIVSHVAARASLPMFMYALPPARTDGLAAAAADVPIGVAAIAALSGVVAVGLGLGLKAAALAVVAMAFVVMWARGFCLRQFGGQTGDVLGALEQTGEIVVLLLFTRG